MILRSKLKSVSLTLAGAALASLTSGCGDKVDVQEAKDDSLRVTVWEKNNEVKLGADGKMTITRVVLSKTTPRVFNQGSSAADSRTKYSVEFWGRYIDANGRADTATSVPRYGKIDGLLADKDGNLYVDGFEPGTIIDNPDLKTASGTIHKDFDRYEIGVADALVSKFDWLTTASDAVFTDSVSTTTVNFLNLGNLFTIGNKVGDNHKKLTPLATNAIFTFSGTGSNENDTIYSKNDSYTTFTAPAACVIVAKDDTTGNQSTATTATLATEKLNLGRKLLDSDAVIDSSDTAKNGATGAQDLYVTWTINYRIAGMNINTGKMNWYMTKTAQAYQNRELPSVDATTTTAAPSGLEKVIRECNDKATKNDTWAIVSRDLTASTIALTTTHCEGLKSDTSKTSVPLNSFSFTTPYTCDFSSLANLVSQGNWTGTAHTDRISATGATSELADTETSDIAEVTL